jgi:Na+-transporting NADH:ubiquinone oxidoreductase subunit NqrB
VWLKVEGVILNWFPSSYSYPDGLWLAFASIGKSSSPTYTLYIYNHSFICHCVHNHIQLWSDLILQESCAFLFCGVLGDLMYHNIFLTVNLISSWTKLKSCSVFVHIYINVASTTMALSVSICCLSEEELPITN